MATAGQTTAAPPGMKAGDAQTDPWRWCIAIALIFLVLVLHRLTIPSSQYFDEIHYVKAARKLLEMVPANREHPMFAKEAIAASIAVLGDTPFAWRIGSALFGALGLFAFGRLVWAASGQRLATILAMVLLATDFMWFIQSRIAMLDMYSASLTLIGLWQFAAALHSERPRLRLLGAGVALGLAIGSKWSPLPVVMLPGLFVLALRLTKRRHLLRGVGLIEAALWLGALPLAVYWLTYAPAFFYAPDAHRISPFGFIAQHRDMIALQDSVVKHHTYQSTWDQWIFNLRPIWFLYERIDGAQRGILLLGNPLTMLAGLPALVWALWAGIMRRRIDALAMAIAYCVSVGMWPLSGKPVQFYYHYLLPGAFLMGCLALAMAELRTSAGRKLRLAAAATVIASVALFAWFYPIISAAQLHRGKAAFETWMWLASWR